MPRAQGKLTRIRIPGKMQGVNTNGDMTNDSVEYRGRPWSSIDCRDMQDIDYMNESVKQSWQAGQRTIGYYLTTGTILPSN